MGCINKKNNRMMGWDFLSTLLHDDFRVIEMKVFCLTNLSFRYTYNWYTRYPRTVFLEAEKKLAELTGTFPKETKGPESKSAEGQCATSKEEFNRNPMEITDTGGCCAMVVALMALRRVSKLS